MSLEAQHIPGERIPTKMLSLDPFSQWLGIEIINTEIGNCKVGLRIRKEMLNSMGKAHGGIAYALADTAFGFTVNTNGRFAVSIETSINHIEPLEEGDYIVAEATLESLKNKVAFYVVEVKRDDTLVALFKGVAYRTGKYWEE